MDVRKRECRKKFIPLDITHADPQAQEHLCEGGSADHDGLAASTSEARKRQHYARPGHDMMCPSTIGAMNKPLSRWKALGVSG